MTDDLDAIDALLETAIAIQKPPRDFFPWEDQKGGEDHVFTEQALTRLYKSLGLNVPRFSWAPSPAAMYTAINMLRHIQAGQRHKFIEGLVVADDIEGHARRTVLDAIIDRTVTTTMGGCIRSMIPWQRLNDPHLWVTDVTRFLAGHNFVTQTVLPGPSVNEVTLYPANYYEAIAPWRTQLLSFVPYTHVCWICLPPVEARMYDDNHLAFMRFRDGYTISLDDPKALPEATEAGLPALPGETVEPEQRSVLFAMCAIGKHDGCSGRIEDSVVITTCSCECHHKKELAIASVEG